MNPWTRGTDATDVEPTPATPATPASPPPVPPPAAPVTLTANANANANADAGGSTADRLDLDAVAADLAAVEAALERLEVGTYGTCIACGDPIDDATLAASPTAEACAAHLPSIAG